MAKYTTVLTILLSVMAFMHASKAFLERWIDKFLVWNSKRRNELAPVDVMRRITVLEEHTITGAPGSRQRRMSSMHNILKNNNNGQVLFVVFRTVCV